ncbi:MAG: HypC/HybG/HupF family hydrogenase formation chaperone [Elusimicrobia bacterium]|nr:HypC/HybG/HupF family hydrogenase formation chaperone [Elusimicrobiota bacterium]
MCLAVPLKITEVNGRSGKGEISGVAREVDLGFLEDVKPGDYVLLHAGFAIQKVSEEEALKTLRAFEELGSL